MAKKIIQQLIDDLDGTIITEGAGESIEFSVDGISYEIDLTNSHAQELRNVLAPFIAAARRSSTKTAARSAGRTAGAAAAPSEAGKIRDWARANGLEVPSRGRVPASVTQAYRDAH